jgi:hypothetical protein
MPYIEAFVRLQRIVSYPDHKAFLYMDEDTRQTLRTLPAPPSAVRFTEADLTGPQQPGKKAP